jgi:hypothetical protein
MAPLVSAGLDTILAFQIGNALAATIGLCLAMYLVWKRTDGMFWPTVMVAIATYCLFLSHLPTITPDGWVTTWVLLFTFALLEFDDRLNPGTRRARILAGAALGAIGVLGYLIKQYLIPVFIVVIIIWLIVRMVRDRRSVPELRGRALVRRWVVLPGAIALTSLILAAPWVTALSIKYDKPTVGSSFSVNIGMKFDPTSATAAPSPTQVPVPPNKYAVSYGEDRGVETTAPGGTFASPSPLAYRIRFYLDQRIQAFPYYLNKVDSIAPFAFVTVLGLFLALLFGWIRYKPNRSLVTIATVWAVYFAGYAAITQASSGGGNVRYYWPLLPLSAVLISLMIPRLWRSLSPRLNTARKVIAIALIAVIPLTAISENAVGLSFPFSTSATSPSVAYLFRPPYKPAPFDLAEVMKKDGIIKPGDRILGTNYRTTLRLGYYLGAQVYGTSGHNYQISNPALQKVLTKDGINYFITYTPVLMKTQPHDGYATPVKNYLVNSICSDSKSSFIEPCNITVFRLNN